MSIEFRLFLLWTGMLIAQFAGLIVRMWLGQKFKFPLDCDVYAWDAFMRAVFWAISAVGILFFSFLWIIRPIMAWMIPEWSAHLYF